MLAQEEARLLNHNYIGTEHILLGLIHEGEGVAAKALETMGIGLDSVRQQVTAVDDEERLRRCCERISGGSIHGPASLPVRVKDGYEVLQLAFTKEHHSPNTFELLSFLGPAEARRRLASYAMFLHRSG